MSYCFVLQLDLLHQIMILKISWSRHISQGNNTGGSSKKYFNNSIPFEQHQPQGNTAGVGIM